MQPRRANDGEGWAGRQNVSEEQHRSCPALEHETTYYKRQLLLSSSHMRAFFHPCDNQQLQAGSQEHGKRTNKLSTAMRDGVWRNPSDHDFLHTYAFFDSRPRASVFLFLFYRFVGVPKCFEHFVWRFWPQNNRRKKGKNIRRLKESDTKNSRLSPSKAVWFLQKLSRIGDMWTPVGFSAIYCKYYRG